MTQPFTPRLLAMHAEAERYRAEHERIPSVIDGLRMRKVMRGRTDIDWQTPRRWFTGWLMDSRAAAPYPPAGRPATRIIVTVAPYDHDGVNADGGHQWIHASMSHHDRTPDYRELAALHDAAFGLEGRSHLLFVPVSEHVNLHEHTLHLWGRLDGTRILPDFGAEGTI